MADVLSKERLLASHSLVKVKTDSIWAALA
jgi:hypothetical protein